jgi:uncharacterized protein YbgA (DUF1722 family)/uncharacterized protein YbbK (DUF523 family)
MQPIRLGVSSCLLGEQVRYDGGHKHDRYITDTLGRFFELVPVCPEKESGMSVPREAMRLMGDPSAPRLMTIRSGKDLTGQMQSFCDHKLAELTQNDLCGFIFKKNSPSSGLFRVKVYQERNGVPFPNGRGLFAAAFCKQFPLLPVEEEGRLYDPVLRENFLERVFCCRRWKDYEQHDGSLAGLVDFHARHKFLILSHSPQLLRELGRLVAQGKQLPIRELREQYLTTFIKALSLHATPAKQVNTLQHVSGFFKRQLEPWEKQELLDLIEQYRQRLLPLIVPITLLNHYIRKYRHDYLLQQVYLSPHPQELMLRNHV